MTNVSADARSEMVAQIVSELRGQILIPGRPSVVTIVRSAFYHDVVELRGRAQNYNWLGINIVDWGEHHKRFLPPKILAQLGHFRFTGPEYEPYWEAAKDFSKELLSHLSRELGVVAVLAANFDYAVDEGLRRACRELPIPFVVLNREIPILKSEREFYHSYYRNFPARPIVDGTAVGSELTKQELIDANVLPADHIRVTGFPRLDPWINYLRNEPASEELTSIVLLSYTDPDYRAGNNYWEMIHLFAAASQRHANQSTRFIVKCKDSGDQMDSEKLARGAPIDKLEFTHRSTFKEIAQARVVIGYNSLAFAEALLSRASLLTPQWGPCHTSESDQLFWRENPAHRAQITFLEGPEHLAARIDAAVAGERAVVDIDARIKLLQEIIHFDPRRPASLAVEAFVDHYVMQRRQGFVD